MEGNKRNFSLSLWDNNDNFLCLLKSSNSDFEGQSYNENINRSITGEETLTFSLPMYVFNKDTLDFEKNKCWTYIFNEQKIRYVEYDLFLNTPKKTKEFVLKTFDESRNGEEKIVQCTCESLALYELSKVGWGISFNTDYVSSYELKRDDPNLLTLDYWMEKIFYWESNLGRVSNTTECTKMLQGLQLRNEEGEPIASAYVTDNKNNNIFQVIDEPICEDTESEDYLELENLTGWHWEILATTKNKVDDVSTTTILYEDPVVSRYHEITSGNFVGQSLQKRIGVEEEPSYRQHPIVDTKTYEYVLEVKKRLYTVERSNIFSIIQDLSEIFEVWPHFIYTYNEDDGKIIDRKILFKTEAINDEIKFDFAYGKNLASCSRNANSNDLITKLIVTDTESNINDGQILSIRNSTANPTGENYLYNFDYFYNLGSLSRLTNDEIIGLTTVVEHSDEYKINLHSAKLKQINNQINNLQSYLVPLYNRQMELEGDQIIKEGEITGYIDNIQSIQNKIDAIPPDDRVIKSWSEDASTYNHVGETKTFSVTTNPDDITDNNYLYVKFNRDDVIYNNNINVQLFTLNNSNELIEVEGDKISVSSYIPRIFTYGDWHANTEISLPENDNKNFITFVNNNRVGGVGINNIKIDYSELGDKQFIKGIYFKLNPKGSLTNYGRIRYKYCPLAYYYLLINDYWKKIQQVKKEKEIIDSDLQEINNRIVTQELELNNLLNVKKRLIFQFERKYKPYIREGYWEPSDYQAQIESTTLYTNNPASIYEGLITVNTPLNELNLNSSLHNYTHYINLGNAENIDIDSISMRTYGGQMFDQIVPRYRGNDFELYRSPVNDLIVAISPSLIDSINLYKGDNTSNLYESIISYSTNGNIVSQTIEWNMVAENNPLVQDTYIYLSNDNIITNALSIEGTPYNSDKSIKLELYTDFDYSFDYAGYMQNGQRVPLNEQTSYSTNIYYDYITKITLKLTNLNNRIMNIPPEAPEGTIPNYSVNYTKETTLGYLMNDAVATSKKYSEPQITYNISVVDLSSLNGYEYYKPTLGQKVPIWDIEMGLNGYEGFITSISKDLESPENTQIEIATYKTRFEDIFQKLTATMTDVRYNESGLYTAADSFNTDGTIKTQVFRKALEENLNRISIGVNNDIKINEKDGILLTDRDTGRVVKLIGNGVFISEDGQNWKTGITGEGINTDALLTGSIDTKKISIWNESEEQYRFMWTDQGLFAYGDKYSLDNPTNSVTTTANTTSLSTPKDIIDYNKYVKFNQNGLDFNDNGKSALSLGWGGLRINTQNNSLNLDADKGLVLQEYDGTGSATTRLELGKLDNGNLYGLRLHGSNGIVTFQSDTKGDLWLNRHIRVGGSIQDDEVHNPTAGIYGLSNLSEENKVPLEMQMGLRRSDSGEIIWDDTPIRFWAGPQTKEKYKENIHISDISGTTESNFNILSDSTSPSLAKFKVSANGDIIASGIDVGGWIGEGDKLHSNDNEAILRSNGYIGLENNKYPLIAIGKNGEIDYGTQYNFRVYQDGSIDIGNGQFTVSPSGAVVAKNIAIQGGSSDTQITGGSVGGLTIQNNGLEIIRDGYKTALYAVAGNTTDKALQMGPADSPNFYITGKGSVIANDITITGKNNTNDQKVINVGSGNFTVDKNGNLVAKAATITGEITATSGRIANFIIGMNDNYSYLYTNGKDKITSTSSGIYLGDNGICIGNKDSYFKATANGSIIIKGNNGGTGDLITSDNFSVSQKGNVIANNITFSGNITAIADKKEYKGLNTTEFATVTLDSGVTRTYRVVKGLIVGRDS